ncbi:MAG: dihydroorotase [Blautia sp.]|nr:dihydroorotase [Blautia sp.]
MGILIRKGRIVDAASGIDETADLYLDDGFVREIGNDLTPREKNDRIIDAEGCLVMPGIVDLHVHFRDPGQTQKEDIETGSRAAARGGVTTVVAMPNTSPVIDSPDRVSYVQNKAEQVAPIRVFQAAALSRGQKGEELSDLEGLAAAGVRAFSEDGKSLMNARLMREAMKIAARYDIPVFDHCEDIELRGDGCMNEDENAKRLGLPGICNAVEDIIAGRDILLARDTGARLHLCHCSTEGAAFMMKLVKQSGSDRITAEVCPHHLLFTSDDIPRDDPNYKMNPPLRTRRDVDALLEGLKDGSIDVISTDHAPHTAKDKSGSMRNAAFGIVGLETSLALIYTELVGKGVLTLRQMIEKMCLNPARILGIDAGTIAPGHRADVIIVDTENEYVIDRNTFVSKGKNTPFHGWKVRGKVKYTICNGKVVWEDKK